MGFSQNSLWTGFKEYLTVDLPWAITGAWLLYISAVAANLTENGIYAAVLTGAAAGAAADIRFNSYSGPQSESIPTTA